MKARNIIGTFLISFLLMPTIIMTTASSYEVGFEVDDEIIWVCNKLDESKMENIFGEDWDNSGIFNDLDQGDRSKWRITVINEDTDFLGRDTFEVSYDFWEWTSSDKWGNEDSQEINIKLQEPDEYLDNHKPSGAWFWIPIDPADYLSDIDLDPTVDVDGTSIEIDFEEGEYGGGIPEEDITIVGKYNNDGILSSVTYLDNNDESFCVISLAGYIPGYEIPLILGISLTSIIGIISIILKKNKD